MSLQLSNFAADAEAGWLRMLSVLHKQGAVFTRGWAGSFRSWEFDELLCAIYERYAAANRPPPVFEIEGVQTDPDDPESIALLRVKLNRIGNKVEFLQQVHLAILELEDVYSQYDFTPITRADMLSWGLKEAGHTFPEDFHAAKAVLLRLNYRSMFLFREDEVFNFMPAVVQGFVYADWPLPRYTEEGNPIEGFSIRNEEACHGDYALTDKFDSRYQNRIQLRYNRNYAPRCSWLFANVEGGALVLPAAAGVATVDGELEVRYMGRIRPNQIPFWDEATFSDFGFRGIRQKLAPRSKVRVKFDYRDMNPDAYYYLTKDRWMGTSGGASNYSYTTRVLYMVLNGILLPHNPLAPVDVSGILRSEDNVLEVAFEGAYRWSNIYIGEVIHLDTDIPAPAVVRYNFGCYESVGIPGSDYYYSYYYGGDNRKCWELETYTEHAKFDLHGLVNAGFMCYGEGPAHWQEKRTSGARSRTTLQEQSLRLSFVIGDGIRYDTFYSYVSTAGVSRGYLAFSGYGKGEITEMGVRVPADVAWNLTVTVVPEGGTPIRLSLSCYGNIRGQIRVPLPPCDPEDLGEVFTTQFASNSGFYNNPVQPATGTMERA